MLDRVYNEAIQRVQHLEATGQVVPARVAIPEDLGLPEDAIVFRLDVLLYSIEQTFGEYRTAGDSKLRFTHWTLNCQRIKDDLRNEYRELKEKDQYQRGNGNQIVNMGGLVESLDRLTAQLGYCSQRNQDWRSDSMVEIDADCIWRQIEHGPRRLKSSRYLWQDEAVLLPKLFDAMTWWWMHKSGVMPLDGCIDESEPNVQELERLLTHLRQEGDQQPNQVIANVDNAPASTPSTGDSCDTTKKKPGSKKQPRCPHGRCITQLWKTRQQAGRESIERTEFVNEFVQAWNEEIRHNPPRKPQRGTRKTDSPQFVRAFLNDEIRPKDKLEPQETESLRRQSYHWF